MQSKLEDELKRLEDVFQERKRAMEVASEEFAVKLKKVCDEKPQVCQPNKQSYSYNLTFRFFLI